MSHHTLIVAFMYVCIFMCRWFEEKELRDKEKRESLNLLPAFSQSEYRSFILTEMTSLTLDTILYTFSISPDHSVGLLIGQHILLR